MKKRLLVIILMICVFCLAAVWAVACSDTADTGTTPGTTPGGEDPPVVDPPEDEGPHATSITVGDVRVQLLSDTLVRVEDKGPKGFENRVSYIVSKRDWQDVEYTETKGEGETLISTESFVVHVPEGGAAEDVYVTNNSDVLLWEYTGRTDTNVYLPSPSDELKSWYFTDSPRIIPSEYGYSINEDGGLLQDWDFDNNATDVFVFLPKGNYKQFCQDYTDLTGKSEFISLQMLGFWDSRWYAYSEETALKQIKDYTDRGYSIDVLVVDTDWRDASSGVGYDINTTLFPNMSRFLDKCHELGVNVIFNDHPEPVTGGNGLDADEVEYRNSNLTLILSLGLDYWWYDRNWHVALNSFSPEISVYAFGMYAYNWVTSEYLASITDINEYAERALIMGNVDGCLHGKWNYASDISAHRYSIQWTGDIGSNTAALAQEIYASVFGGAEVGLPYMSSDIGGHTAPVTDSMYVRWFQYGALSSILRVHCTSTTAIGQDGRMPWLFGDTAEEVAHTYMDLRYRLLPLYYSLARDNYEYGLPLMRRLDINYPQYVESQRNDEYMLGDYIIVAPIDEGTPNIITPDSQLTHGANDAPGLEAKYFNNKDWSGTPVRTQVDSNINFDWGNGGPAGLGSDKFSIEWNGYITIGAKPAKLAFFADDTVKAWVDGKLVADGTGKYDVRLETAETYAAGSKHSLKVQYNEDGGGAHVYMYYVEVTSAPQYNSRTVFIPDGTWRDVWSGERFVGPATHKVSHPLETSPIFVREGALVPLARNMVNTSDKDWSELSLDVYPAVNYDAKATLYEDDTLTVAHKAGEYRKTDITMNFDRDNTAANIKIGKAVGGFNGKLAFDTRKWTVRVHVYDDWGNVDYVKLNGKVIGIEEFDKDAAAKPFAFNGASPDSKVIEFTFSGKVTEEYAIQVVFSGAKESAKNTEYDATAVGYKLSVGDAGISVDLTEAGKFGWVSFGDQSAEKPVTKKGTESLITYTGSFDTPAVNSGSFFTKTYSDGTIAGAQKFNTSISSIKDISLELKTRSEKSYYVLYLGGNRCTAKLTVRDRAGNVRTEMFGNIDGAFLRRAVIECEGADSTLYVTYSTHATENSGTGTPTYITLLCGYVSDTVTEIGAGEETDVTASIYSCVDPDASADLSVSGADLGLETLDWMHFSGNGTTVERRLGGSLIGEVTFASGSGFGDYPVLLKYSDGDKIGAHTGTRNGTCSTGLISLTIDVTPNVKYVRLYTGAWKASNNIEVYNVNGELLCSNPPFAAGDSSVPKIVTIAVNTTKTDKLIIRIVPTASNGGNVSLPAVAVIGENGSSAVSVQVAEPVKLTVDVDLSERGTKDWLYATSNESKAGADSISALTLSSFKSPQTNYAVSLSYSDGAATPTASELKGYVNCDFVRFTVKVDENTDYVEVYVSFNSPATAGFVVLDEEGRAIYRGQPCDSTASGQSCYVIRFAVTAAEAHTLTFQCYKGGTGAGQFGLAAIAVGEKRAEA